MDWKIGDVGMCVKIGALEGASHLASPPLRYNAEYLVQNVYQCPKCRAISLDVGLSAPIEVDESFMGTQCCTEFIPCKEIHWCSAMRFVKRKTKQEQLVAAIEEEDYERAGVLRDELKLK